MESAKAEATTATLALASISYTGASIGTYSYGWDDRKSKTSDVISG